MAEKAPAPVVDSKAQESSYRAIATQHALSIQEKKNLQTKVLDTIIVAFDLPIDQTTTSAQPTPADATRFRDCAFLFRPDDLDEVVSERNIDHRCGYALCSNESKPSRVARRWDARAGKFIEEKIASWCSVACKGRTQFVRRQLSAEPAWLRYGQVNHIRLQTDTEELVEPEVDSQSDHVNAAEELALERGDSKYDALADLQIIEKQPTKTPKPPKITRQITVGDILEGLPVRTIGVRREKDKDA